MVAGNFNIRIFGGELLRHLVPEHHRIFLGVGFGDGSQLAATLLRLLEAEAQDAFHALAGEDGGFDSDLVFGALMHASAGTGIFTFGIFTDAENVESIRFQRSLHAGQKPVRADIGVLHKCLADRQKQAVQRYRIRHLRWPADRAQQNGVEAAQGLDAILRHHRAGLLVEGAGPGEFGAFKRKTGAFCCGVENLPGGISHAFADAVSGNECDAMRFQDVSPVIVRSGRFCSCGWRDRPPVRDPCRCRSVCNRRSAGYGRGSGHNG